MQHKKTVQVPATSRESVDYITCDLCGCRGHGSSSSSSSWFSNFGNSNSQETEISISVGDFWPESGRCEKKFWHICPKCFTDKLIPWLESQNATPTIEDEGY